MFYKYCKNIVYIELINRIDDNFTFPIPMTPNEIPFVANPNLVWYKKIQKRFLGVPEFGSVGISTMTGAQPAEGLAPLGVRGEPLRSSLKTLQHYGNIVPRGLRVVFTWAPIMPRSKPTYVKKWERWCSDLDWWCIKGYNLSVMRSVYPCIQSIYPYTKYIILA